MTEKTNIQALNDDQLDLVVGGTALSGQFSRFIYKSCGGNTLSFTRENPVTGYKNNMDMPATTENMARVIDSSRRKGITGLTLYAGGDRSKGQTFTLEEIESWL